MLGFLIGTACLIGFFKLARMGRRGRWGYGGGWGPSAFGYGAGHGGCGSDGGYAGYGGACRGRDAHGEGDGGRDGAWSGRGWGGPFGGGLVLRGLFARLDATPGQEKVIKSALGDLRGVAEKVRGEVKASRPELASAIRQEQFDETLFGELSHKVDEAAQTMRRAAVDAIAKVHAVLDDRQRKLLAELIESGPGFRGWGGGGPYRRGAGGSGVSL